MRNPKKYILLILSAGVLATLCVGAPTDIQPPQKRATVVDTASLLAKNASAEEMQIPDDIRNPFNPSAMADNRVVVKAGSDKELLAILADQLKPTGVMGLGDNLELLLKGQKPVKVNEKLTLSFDGINYDVEVIAIDRINFSLRYNQAEITRPIKPGKNP